MCLAEPFQALFQLDPCLSSLSLLDVGFAQRLQAVTASDAIAHFVAKMQALREAAHRLVKLTLRHVKLSDVTERMCLSGAMSGIAIVGQ